MLPGSTGQGSSFISLSLFGGTWLSDYVPNRLGGFIQEQTPQKPDCQLIGEDGNIFNLIGIAARTLRADWSGRHAGIRTHPSAWSRFAGCLFP